MLVGGLDTVINAMAFSMAHLAVDHKLRDYLAANPDRLNDAAWEFLRRFPLVSSSREVRYDLEFDGVALRTGERLSSAM